MSPTFWVCSTILLHTINTTRRFQEDYANVLTRVCLNFLRATGCMNPIVDIVEWAHNFGPEVLVDECQSVPHMPVDVQALGIDFLVASSHKVEAKPIHQEFNSSLRIMEWTLKSMLWIGTKSWRSWSAILRNLCYHIHVGLLHTLWQRMLKWVHGISCPTLCTFCRCVHRCRIPLWQDGNSWWYATISR